MTSGQSENDNPTLSKKWTTGISIAGILGCLATCCGLSLTAVALIPAFWPMFFPKTVPEVISATPLKIDFVEKYRGAGLFFLPDTSPDNIDWENLEIMSLPAFNVLKISVTNQSDKTIILNNKLPIRLIDFQPLEGPLNGFSVGGGSGYYRNFVASIPSAKGVNIVWAVFEEVDESGQPITQAKPDFFTLQPGEVEAFSIEIRFDTPGQYEFQPGVEYFQDTETVQMWADDSVIAYMPQRVITWTLAEQANEYIRIADCSFNFSYDGPYPNFNNVYICSNP